MKKLDGILRGRKGYRRTKQFKCDSITISIFLKIEVDVENEEETMNYVTDIVYEDYILKVDKKDTIAKIIRNVEKIYEVKIEKLKNRFYIVCS